MNRLLIFSVLLLALASCEKSQPNVEVKNTTELNRVNETVELNWKQLVAKVQGLTKDNVVVYDAAGKEIPSQVIFNGGAEPQALIFQATVSPNSQAAYTVKTGQRSDYPKQAYGRFVPERMDDYAWENNLVAHRMYGPALEATGEISNGIDTWVKNTGELVIDEWYKTGDYHKDHGKGFDGYKVGRTLGSGAMAPYYNGKIVLGNNYITQTTLDDGPVRTSFKLTYAPYKVGGVDVTETRVISLDANTRFNRMQETYENAPADMQVAAGIVTRTQPGEIVYDTDNFSAGYWEPQNNDNNDNNGHTGIAVILPSKAQAFAEAEGHILAIDSYEAGKPYVYYMGSAWSKGGVPTAADWFKTINEEKVKIQNPLQISVR